MLGLMLIDTRGERPGPPQPAPRRTGRNVNWRMVGGLAAGGGLVMGSSAVGGAAGYGMLLAGVIATGLGVGRGHPVQRSGLRDYRQ